MPKKIQIRDVPDKLYRQLTSRAALEGMSLSDYMLREMERVVEKPTAQELRKRIERRASVKLETSPADAVRAERDGR